MTVQQMAIEAWEQSGRFSDLNPYSDPPTNSTFDITTTGGSRLLSYINRGYKSILFWKYPNGRQVRFPITKRTQMFYSNATTTVPFSSATSTTLTLTPFGSPIVEDDCLNGWIIEVTGGTGVGQKRIIADTVESTETIYLVKAWDTTPDATSTFKLYHHQYKIVPSTAADATYHIQFDPVSNFYAPEVIHDLTNQRTLHLSPNQWSMTAQRTGTGQPSVYFWDQGSIWFDVAPDDVYVYEVEYRYIPPDLTLATDEPQIPEPWHTPIVYWAMHEIYRRHQESGEAWAVKKDLQDMMNNIISQDELLYDKTYGIMEVSGYGDNY